MRWFPAVVLSLVVASPLAAQTRSVSLPEGHEFTNPDRGPLALSPDGTELVYLARATVFVRPVTGTGAPTLVQGPLQGRGKSNIVFSPDGQQLLYWAQDDSVLQRVPVRGGTPVTVAKVDNPLGVSWESDGTILVGGGDKGVLRVAATGGAVETVVKVAAGEAARSPQALPGGDNILFTLGAGTPTNWDQARIVVQSARTGQRTVLATGRDARYLPTGHLVYVTGRSIMGATLDVNRLAPGPATLLANDVASFPTGSALYSVAANGALAFVTSDAAPIQLEMVGLDGSRRPLGAVPAGTAAPRVSRDGRKVTFAAAGDIYVADLDNVAGATVVIRNGTFPLFSPDGQWLAFGSLGTRRDSGEERLFMQRSDGSGDAQLIVKPGRAPEHWLEGEQGFSFITHRGGANNYDLWFYSPEKKEVEPLVVVNESAQLSSALSPDRKWVAYMSSESGDWQIYVQPYPTTGAKYQVTTAGGRSPMWTADGRIVYDNDGKLFAVAARLSAQPSFGSPMELPVSGHIQPLLRRNWDMMPNGTQMLMLFRPGPKVNVVSDWTSRLASPAR